MKWLTFEIHRGPGFRLNLIDILFVLILSGLSLWIRSILLESYFWLVPLYLALTFFLYCNVFRIGTALEVMWCIPFVAIAIWVIVSDSRSNWLLGFVIVESWKWILILYKLLSGSYRGAGHRTINKGLSAGRK